MQLQAALKETKVCSKCGEEKLLSEFYKSKYTKSGVVSQCKSCDKKRVMASKHRCISEGRCPGCGELPLPGLKRCASCHTKNLLQNKNYRELQAKHHLCNICGKPLDDTSYKRCSECRRKANELRVKRRREFSVNVGNYFNNTCYICGLQSDHVEIYDCHHVDPKTKLFGIAQADHRDWETEIVPELEKCVYLCSNCHRSYHYGRFDGKIEMGELVLIPGKISSDNRRVSNG